MILHDSYRGAIMVQFANVGAICRVVSDPQTHSGQCRGGGRQKLKDEGAVRRVVCGAYQHVSCPPKIVR